MILTCDRRMDHELVGGKFQKQWEMRRAGIPVPEFYCATRRFFESVVTPIKPRIRELLDTLEPTEAAVKIQALFQNLHFSAERRDLLLHTYDQMFPPDTLVSVRSSMIGYKAEESEDSADNPFAGISASFLYVQRAQIPEKIMACFASGFSAHAILYRKGQNMDPMGFAVAAGVQRMVHGERSFVLFTCNPRSAARETVIIAGYGIGEGVVQERVAVDHYFHNSTATPPSLRTEIAAKDTQLTLARAGYGLEERPVAEALRNEPCLNPDEVTSLTQMGAKIERLFRAAQDIEGTITGDGRIHILQARPIALEMSRQRVWTNANVTESFPGVTTPLTYSLARYFYRVIFYDCYRMLGISPSELHDRHETLDRMIGYIGGRVYYCLTSFYLLHSQSPLFPIFRAHWEKMMGFLSSYEIRDAGLIERAAIRARAAGRLAKAVAVIAWRYVTHQRDIRKFHAWWEDLIVARRGKRYDETDPMAAMTDFHDVWRQVGNRWGITLMNDTYLPVIYGWVEGLFKKWGLDSHLLSGLLCGDEDLVSVEIILSAVGLAERAGADPETKAAFSRFEAMELWRRIEAGRLEAGFTKTFLTHLHLYGDRGFQELKIEQPNLRHTPWVLVRMVQSYVREGLTVEAYRATEREVRRKAEEALRTALLRRPARRLLLRSLLSTLRRLIRNRENSRYCRSELFSYSKAILNGIASQYGRQGLLRDSSDIFYLTLDDIFGHIDGTGVTENLQGLADLRRKETEAHGHRETPTQITTLGPVRRNNLYEAELAVGHGVLQGLGSSSGLVRGTARVVIDPNQPVDLGGDGILIARETDPGWLFLMLSSKAIVVERGSMLSHTAITGRKFGIPTVVSLPQATIRIPDGARIEVDGSSGLVTLLEEE
ncbi:MAG: PEP/pyruvate-binding domain-containing protein [Bryobacteraceae bacterium]